MISLRRLLTSSLFVLLALLLVLQYFVFAPQVYSLGLRDSATNPLLVPPPTVTPPPVRLRAGSAMAAKGQTTVQIPLDLLDVNSGRPLGALTMSLQYDATRLKAVSCNVNAAFDLLLCNLAKSGVIQLAGVDASGIGTNIRVADLTFEILQPAKLSVPLTVQIKQVSNRDGDTLSAAPQNGAVDLSCVAVDSNCSTLYLPIVQR